MIPCRAGVLLFSFLVSFVVCAGETVQVAGVPLEETYRAFEPDNGWTRIDYVLRPTKESFIRCRLILPSKEKWTGPCKLIRLMYAHMCLKVREAFLLPLYRTVSKPLKHNRQQGKWVQHDAFQQGCEHRLKQHGFPEHRSLLSDKLLPE